MYSSSISVQNEVWRYAEDRRARVEMECDRAVEKPLQEGMDGRIGLDHIAGDPAEQNSTEPNQNRETGPAPA